MAKVTIRFSAREMAFEDMDKANAAHVLDCVKEGEFFALDFGAGDQAGVQLINGRLVENVEVVYGGQGG